MARLRAVKGRGSMATCSPTVASAEREGSVAGHQKRRSRRRSRLSRAGRGLTLRSRRGPTAGHQARAGGTRYILTSPGLASCRWSRLTSNVRPRETHRAVLQQNQRLSAWTKQPQSGGATKTPYSSARYCRSVPPDRKAQRQKARGRNNAAAGYEALTGNRRVTSEHRAAWEAIVFSRLRLGRICHWCVCGQSRVGAAQMRATPPSPARSGKAPWRGIRNCAVVAGPGCRAPGEA